MAAALAKPRLELMAANLLRDWLMKSRHHDAGRFSGCAWACRTKTARWTICPPPSRKPKLQAAVEKLLAKYPAEEVAVYLNAFYTMNDVRWPNLEAMLKNDPRLQFGG